MSRLVFALAICALALRRNVQDATERLSNVKCAVSQRSYAAPWDVWYAESVELPGLLSEPYVLSFAGSLLGDMRCTASAHGKDAELTLVRLDRELDLVIFKIEDKDFWEDGPGPLERAGIMDLGSHGTVVTQDSSVRVADAVVAAYEPQNSPVGSARLSFALTPALKWDGFFFDKSSTHAAKFAGLVVGGRVIPEWTLGEWDGPNGLPAMKAGVIRCPNDAMREKLGVPEENGVMFRYVQPDSGLAGVADGGDVLLKIRGEPVAHDGTVKVPSIGVRLPVEASIAMAREPISVTVLHEGEEVEKEISFSAYAEEAVGGEPSYLIVGGLVFAPLTPSLMEEMAGDWLLQVPAEVYGYTTDFEPPVALANVLHHSINEFFPTDTVRIVHSVNGERVHNLKTMLELVSKALEDKDEKFIRFNYLRVSPDDNALGVIEGDELPKIPDTVFYTSELVEAQNEMLAAYGVPASMSEDLCEFKALDEMTQSICDDAKASKDGEHTFLHRKSSKTYTISKDLDNAKSHSKAWGGHPHSSRKRRGLGIEDDIAKPEAPATATDAVDAILRRRGYGGVHDASDAFGPGIDRLTREIDSELGVRTRETEARMIPEQPGASRSLERSQDAGSIPLRHVVKILTLSAERSFMVPWRFKKSSRSTGSGIMVDGEDLGLDKGAQIILTNAHVVNDYQVVYVQRQDLSRKLKAEVLYIAPDVDIAILRVIDHELWEGVNGLKLQAELPVANSMVRVAGYPLGGNAVSVTTGVVSRVIAFGYEFSQPYALNSPGSVVAVQVDAAINPGNSGGPVFNEDGAFVGLAFAGMRSADNMGFVIPLEVIKGKAADLFAAGTTNSTYSGHAELGASWVDLDSPALREYMKMGDATGIALQSIAPLGALNGTLKSGDVLLSIDGQDIAGDGTVVMPGKVAAQDVRMPFDGILTSKPEGASTKLRVLRSGEEKSEEVDVVFAPVEPRVPRYDTVPSYVVVGGLIFTKLTVPLYNVFQWAGPSEYGQQVPGTTSAVLNTWRHTHGDDVVVLLDAMDAPVNAHYHFPRLSILHYLNGEPVTSLTQLTELLPSAFESPFLEFSFQTNGFPTIVMNSTLASDDSQILDENAIPAPASAELLTTWCENTAKARKEGRVSHYEGCESDVEN